MGGLAMKKSPGRETWGPRVGKGEGAAGGLPRGLPGPLPPGAPGSPAHGRGGHLGRVSWKDASKLRGLIRSASPVSRSRLPVLLAGLFRRGLPLVTSSGAAAVACVGRRLIEGARGKPLPLPPLPAGRVRA